MIVKVLIISFIHICHMNDINNKYMGYDNGRAIMINPYGVVVDVIHVADMDKAYGTYAAAAADEYFDNHDYDDNTDNETDDDNDVEAI